MRYAKTPLGQQAFKQRSALLSARQRSAFLMFDGEKPLQTILQAVAGLGVTMADVEHLVAQGFLEPSGPAEPAPVQPAPVQHAVVDSPSLSLAGQAAVAWDPAAAGSGSQRTPMERYQQAYPLAVKLTSSLGLRGFRLNLAVEAAGGYEELLALFPKIQSAAGAREAAALEAALKS